TSSMCQEEVGSHKHNADPVERWCEEFAASALLPWDSVEAFLRQKVQWDGKEKIDDLSIAGKIARKFKVSLRASALRLIANGVAGWELYRSIPKVADAKSGGGGGGGRDRVRIRLDEYVARTARVFLRGVTADVLS